MTNLFYEVAGNSRATTALLFLHGGMGLDHSYFRPFVDALGDDFQLVFLDHRLNGRSPRAAREPVTLNSMAKDACDVALQSVGGKRLVVLGHSFGAFVGVAMLAQAPSIAHGVILVCPALSPTAGQTLMQHVLESGTLAQQQALADGFAGRFSSDEEYARAWSLFMPLELGRGARHLAPAVLEHVRFSVAGFYQFLASGLEHLDWKGVLRGCGAPVLVIAGEEDWLQKDIEGAAAVASLAPQGSYVAIPAAGHFPFAEQPQAFSEAVHAWATASRLR